MVVVVIGVAVDVAVTDVCVHRIEAWCGKRGKPGVRKKAVDSTKPSIELPLVLPTSPSSIHLFRLPTLRAEGCLLIRIGKAGKRGSLAGL
ncbi:hypothetical protein E2C01_015233 [Portunus trituberculatus]|uniref:Uncharacterized protein n=1 Tax=Portunus trituberculatus TaxID=210409 RepID=A0A5B7DME4_PORTR|nr:hypothetical protein [Portunus trituberculatus]